MANTAKGAFVKTSATAPKKVQFLSRYTSLPIALDVLVQKRITLLSPETWEDRNDAYFLERYREEMKLQSVLAICFSRHRETFHHWRVFSSGASGVCIEFDNSLLQSIANKQGYRHGNVEYHWIKDFRINDLRKDTPEVDKWPFLKRKPFEDEREYRIIFESKTEGLRAHPITISLASIRKVTLSPWLPEAVATSVEDIIQSIRGCAGLNVSRSSLLDNAGWRAVINKETAEKPHKVARVRR
jgi:hypothetical protein